MKCYGEMIEMIVWYTTNLPLCTTTYERKESKKLGKRDLKWEMWFDLKRDLYGNEELELSFLNFWARTKSARRAGAAARSYFWIRSRALAHFSSSKKIPTLHSTHHTYTRFFYSKAIILDLDFPSVCFENNGFEFFLVSNGIYKYIRFLLFEGKWGVRFDALKGLNPRYKTTHRAIRFINRRLAYNAVRPNWRSGPPRRTTFWTRSRCPQRARTSSTFPWNRDDRRVARSCRRTRLWWPAFGHKTYDRARASHRQRSCPCESTRSSNNEVRNVLMQIVRVSRSSRKTIARTPRRSRSST